MLVSIYFYFRIVYFYSFNLLLCAMPCFVYAAATKTFTKLGLIKYILSYLILSDMIPCDVYLSVMYFYLCVFQVVSSLSHMFINLPQSLQFKYEFFFV